MSALSHKLKNIPMASREKKQVVPRKNWPQFCASDWKQKPNNDSTLFKGNSYFDRFQKLITAFTRVSWKTTKYTGVSTKSEEAPLSKKEALNLSEISDVICKIIFSIPATDMKQVDKCISTIRQYFASGTTRNVALTDMLLVVFLKKLRERLMYKKRLQDLLKDRQMPLEKKEKWLQRQYEVQGQRLKDTDARSIKFLCLILGVKPAYFYQALHALVSCKPIHEKTLDNFINDVLIGVGKERTPAWCFQPFKEDEEQWKHFQAIKKLAEESESISQTTKVLLKQHETRFFGYRLKQVPLGQRKVTS